MKQEMTDRRRTVLVARHEALKSKRAAQFAMNKCARNFEHAVFTPVTPA